MVLTNQGFQGLITLVQLLKEVLIDAKDNGTSSSSCCIVGSPNMFVFVFPNLSHLIT